MKKLKQIVKNNRILAYFAFPIHAMTIGKYYKNKIIKNFQHNAEEVLICFDKAIKKAGVFYWLEFGTLLGAVREKGLIKKDSDLDFGVFLKDYSKNIEVELLKAGFKKTLKFFIDDGTYGLELQFSLKGVIVDIFFYTLKENTMYCHIFCEQDKETLAQTKKNLGGLIIKETTFGYRGFESIEMFNTTFNIPKSPGNHLIEHYGTGYMTPDPKWNYLIHPKNDKVLKDKLGDFIQFDA